MTDDAARAPSEPPRDPSRPSAPPGPRAAGWRRQPLTRWESAVERTIREAQERGAFDHLEGSGRPLSQEPWDPEWGMAHHVVKLAGETLPWIALSRDVEAAQERLRQALREAARQYAAHPPGPARQAWRAGARERYLEQAAAFDVLLGEFNAAVPIRRLDKGRLPPHVAARQFDDACPTDPEGPTAT